MIDLQKLEAKFNALFEQETEESFAKWMKDKRQRETMSLLGEGVFDKSFPKEYFSKPGFYPFPPDLASSTFIFNNLQQIPPQNFLGCSFLCNIAS